MVPRPHDPTPPRARARAHAQTHAPIWSGRPGFAVYVVTDDATEAAARARATAAAHHCQLAPGTWPVDVPPDTRAIACGPVYVGVRTRRVHALARDVATYYVLRRWVADEVTQPPDPAWPIATDGAPEERAAETAAATVPVVAMQPAWPFTAIGRRVSRAGSKTLGADVITWRGPLLGRTITFTTRPRAIDAHASFLVPSNARIHYRTEHPQFVDVCVHHSLDADARAALTALAQAQDTRPVVVRCVGEPLRQSRHARRAGPRDEPCDDTPPTLLPSLTNRRPGRFEDASRSTTDDAALTNTGDA